MASTDPRTLRATNTTPESGLKTLPVLASNDPDITTALANKAAWVFVSGPLGVLQHVVPTFTMVRL